MLTPANYQKMFSECKLTVNPASLAELEKVCEKAIENQSMYRLVEQGAKLEYGIGIPWPVVAAIHFRESSQDFSRHLHNGDPLTARTVRVPSGRPKAGSPPFTWPESAVDAFRSEWCPGQWDIASCLMFLERYNGLGYQKRGINTPYLWDYTDKYVSGLYTADGTFDPMAKESRPGCVAILKTFEAKGVSLDFGAVAPKDITLH